ncbi:YcxB family protein [Thalassotalea euphylliae]|uniref:YcxB family protein n=1 Tax=Thalassotalea euphylliae TaxID=1655234 RepID=UPI00363D2B53
MSESFEYNNQYTLDKAYLTECFEASVKPLPMMQAYKKALFFVVIGMALLMFTQVDKYLSSFIVVLGVIEALSVKYQRAWWVTRQLWGKSGNSDVGLTMNSEGIVIKSTYVEQHFKWPNISDIEETQTGYLFIVLNQKHYLSKSVLSSEAIDYMLSQIHADK